MPSSRTRSAHIGGASMGGVVHTLVALCVARCRRVLCRAIVRQRLVVRSSIRVKSRRRVAALRAVALSLRPPPVGASSGCCTVPTKKIGLIMRERTVHSNLWHPRPRRGGGWATRARPWGLRPASGDPCGDHCDKLRHHARWKKYYACALQDNTLPAQAFPSSRDRSSTGCVCAGVSFTSFRVAPTPSYV